MSLEFMIAAAKAIDTEKPEYKAQEHIIREKQIKIEHLESQL